MSEELKEQLENEISQELLKLSKLEPGSAEAHRHSEVVKRLFDCLSEYDKHAIDVAVNADKYELESRKMDIDETRVEIEKSKLEKDDKRIEIEQTKASNEAERVSIERSRLGIEEKRVDLEGDKLKRDDERIEIERTKASTEKARVEIEKSRAGIEAAKVEVEKSRLKIERDRILSEAKIKKQDFIAKNFDTLCRATEVVVRIGLETATILIPIHFYSSWLTAGFEFEKTGNITSSTLRGLTNKFKPTRR